LHNIHIAYFNEKNIYSDVVYGDITNLASVFYVQKIKPTAEAYYYDVIRHIALISDLEVRDEKAMLLNANIKFNIYVELSNVMIAFGTLKYNEEWDCDCDMEALMAQRAIE